MSEPVGGLNFTVVPLTCCCCWPKAPKDVFAETLGAAPKAEEVCVLPPKLKLWLACPAAGWPNIPDEVVVAAPKPVLVAPKVLPAGLNAEVPAEPNVFV